MLFIRIKSTPKLLQYSCQIVVIYEKLLFSSRPLVSLIEEKYVCHIFTRVRIFHHISIRLAI